MSNFEIIDDYLTNRLGEQEKLEFERQLGSDPALKADLDLQKHIIEGVKKARIVDLKAMLNNVPVGGGFSSGVATGKIVAAVVTASIIGTSLYFYLRQSERSMPVTPERSENPTEKTPAIAQIVDSSSTTVTQATVSHPMTSDKQKTEKKSLKKKEDAKPASTAQPRIEVVDPSDELIDNSSTHAKTAEGQKSSVTLSHIAVEANSSNKKYNFHYQFKDGKLTLFGTFDKSLYEILEIHGDRHAVFLFYKENYYLLNEKQSKITPLESIKDSNLLKKLKEYRGR